MIRDLVFVSYSHLDKRHLDELLKIWADPYIKAGDDWYRKIGDALDRACLAVLLVSPNFLASKFIDKNELSPLQEAAKAGATRLLCIPVSSTPRHAGLRAQYQWLHRPDSPVDLLNRPRRIKVLSAIADQILEEAVERCSAGPRIDEPERRAHELHRGEA